MGRFDFLRGKLMYIFLVALTGILGYFALESIKAFPKPETISAFIKYYFNAPGPFAIATLSILGTAVSTATLGFTTILHAIWLQELHTILRIILGVVGLGIIFISFYFFNYSFLLIITLAIIGFVVWIFMSGGSSGRRGRY